MLSLTFLKLNALPSILQPHVAPIKANRHAVLWFGHQTRELSVDSDLGGGVDPGFGLIATGGGRYCGECPLGAQLDRMLCSTFVTALEFSFRATPV